MNTSAKVDSSSHLPGAHWPLWSLLLGNSWRKEPLTVFDNWSRCLTLEDQKLSLWEWTGGNGVTTVLQAFRGKTRWWREAQQRQPDLEATALPNSAEMFPVIEW